MDARAISDGEQLSSGHRACQAIRAMGLI